MNLLFSKIKLHNFFSFADSELTLSDMGFTLVEGRNYCKLDNAYSNGSGKSSIFNGVCFALTGETSQGISKGIENIFTDPGDCWVELTFYVDGDEFILRRYKTPKPSLKVWVNGEDRSGKGIRESSQLLSEYIPDLTSTLINSIIILGQGLPSRFTNNKPSHRKEILENLTKSDFMIQSIKDKLDIRQNELHSSLRKKEDEILSNNSKIAVYKKQLISFQKDLEEYEKFNQDNLDDKINFTNGELKNLADKISLLDDETSSLTYTFDTISAKLRNLNIENQNKLDGSLVDINKKINELKSTLSGNEVDYRVLKTEITKLESITDICPTCGQKIPNVLKPDTTEKRAQLKEFENIISSIKSDLSTKENEKNEIVLKYKNEFKMTSSDLENQMNDIRSKLKVLKKDRDQLILNRIDLNRELSWLTNLKGNYTKLLSNMTTAKESISTLENLVENLLGETLEIKSHLDIVQQMVTLAKREFRGVLLTTIIDYLNKRVKQYSKKVFDTEELDFSLNENAIDITYCNKPYENLSGGEKQKIDVIIQLALRDILSRQLNIRSNLLVCDEIFDNMDLVGCNKIVDLISGLTDIDSIFIISHHAQDLELTTDNSLVVEKSESGISKIKIV